jgi:hypothetical protein
MKKIVKGIEKRFVISAMAVLSFSLLSVGAQNVENNQVNIPEDSSFVCDSNYKVLGDRPQIDKRGDTTHIRLGSKGITIVEKDGKTIVDIHDFNKDKDSAISEDSKTKKNKDEDEVFSDKRDKKAWHKFKPHWAGLELTLNNFMTSSFSFSLPEQSQFLELNTGKSIGVNLNLCEFGIPFTSYQGLVTGLGFEFNSYYFGSDSNNITRQNGKIVPKLKPDGSSDYSKNKLKDTYLNIPLMYEIQFPIGNNSHPLYISAGVVGGIKIGSRTKEYYKFKGETKHEIVKDDFYLSPVRIGYQARIGYRWVNLVATYYQTPLFLSNKGPEIHPFDIGLMILNW